MKILSTCDLHGVVGFSKGVFIHVKLPSDSRSELASYRSAARARTHEARSSPDKLVLYKLGFLVTGICNQRKSRQTSADQEEVLAGADGWSDAAPATECRSLPPRPTPSV